jgi:tetratricopeptide (TPR) repeat protein
MYGACPSAKRNAEQIDEDNVENDLTIAKGNTEAEKLFHEALLAYRSINKKKRENRSTENQHLIKYDAEYTVAAQKMKTVLDKYSESPFAVKALRYIDYCYRSLNRSDEFTTILNGILKESISRQMTYTAKRLLVADLLRRKEYADAIILLDELINSQDDVEEKQNLICRKGIIYDKYIKDYDAATDFYSQVIDLDAESPVAWDAQQRLDRMERDYEPGASQEEPVGEELEFAAHNYPNPANPGTSIQYALPQDGHVSIRIYNINGQQVAELLSAEMPAGRHQVRWDGRSAVGTAVATGMYFYRVEFEDIVLSHKFLLLR